MQSNECMEFISAKHIKKIININTSTLRRWADSGAIQCIRMPGGKRLYPKNEIFRHVNIDNNLDERTCIIYARVSSSHQKDDLERQIDILRNQYPDHTLIKDVGSGLNWKRPGIRSLLEQVYSGCIKEIVVTDKDRLCRFGFELLEWILKKHNVKLMVQFANNNSETGSAISNDIELSQDILAICNFFVAKNNGRRSQRNRKLKIEQGESVGRYKSQDSCAKNNFQSEIST